VGQAFLEQTPKAVDVVTFRKRVRKGAKDVSMTLTKKHASIRNETTKIQGFVRGVCAVL
jgi:hypothetical protein